MNLVLRILISALGIFVGSQILDGVKSKNYATAIIVSLVVAFLGATVGMLLKILTLGILAIGLFSLVLDAILLLIADWFLEDFEVRNFWWALALAAIVAIVEMVLKGIVN